MQPSDLRLRLYPDPVLRRRCEPVGDITAAVRACIERMFEIMRESKGVGLAAPQVGWPVRLFVVNCAPDIEEQEDPDGRMALIDPQPPFTEGDVVLMSEGCLSFPGIYFEIRRPAKATIRARNQEGEVREVSGEGLLGRCLLHEYEHLDGKLYLSRASALDRQKARRELRELKRKAKEGGG